MRAWRCEDPSCAHRFSWRWHGSAPPLPGRRKSRAAATSSNGRSIASAPDRAKLPTPPERAPKEGTFAGFTSLRTAPKAGLYTVSLSSGGWVDVVQDGHFLKPKAFSGATDCDGIRKTMKYELPASPVRMSAGAWVEGSLYPDHQPAIVRLGDNPIGRKPSDLPEQRFRLSFP